MITLNTKVSLEKVEVLRYVCITEVNKPDTGIVDVLLPANERIKADVSWTSPNPVNEGPGINGIALTDISAKNRV